VHIPDPADVLGRLESALSTTGALVAGIGRTQWNAPTPCPGWDVGTLTNHVVGGLRIFTAQLTGSDAGGEHEDDWLGDDPVASYRDAADAVLAAWRSPGALTRTLTISLGPVPAPLGAVIEVTEVVVHGLDLAVATGRPEHIDQAQAEWLHDLMVGMGFDAFRLPGVFGPPVPVPDTAPAHLRLLGFLGREVAAADALT
jgi:uncharacterized protein (TIGR03086 family)